MNNEFHMQMSSEATPIPGVVEDTIFDIARLHWYDDPSVICRSADQASH